MIINLRKRATIIMFVVLVAFVASMIFVYGMGITGGSPNIRRGKGFDSTLAVVGKEKIKMADFQSSLYGLANESGLSLNQFNQLKKDDRVQLYLRAWEEAVQNARWDEAIKREQALISDDEAREILMAMPPQWITDDTSFYINGQFNFDRYWEVLSAPDLPEQYRQALEIHKAALARARVEEIVRTDVMNGFRLTVAQVASAQVKTGTKMVLEALFVYELPPVDSNVTKQEIEAYYKEHVKDFEREQWWELRTLIFPLIPSAFDSLVVKQRAEDAEAALQVGADFEQIAIDFTGDSSILIIRPIASLDAIEFETLDTLALNQIGNVFFDRGAWHLPKILEKTRDSITYREIYLPLEAGDSTRKSVINRIEEFRNSAKKGTSIDTLVKQYGVSSRQGPFVRKSKDVFVPYFPYNEAVKTFGLTSRKGDVSEPFPEVNGAYYAFATVSIVEQKLLPLDSNIEFIKSMVIRERAMDAQKEYAYSLRPLIAGGRSFASFLGTPHLSLDTLDFTSYFEAETRYGPRMAGACYTLEPGQMTGPVKCDIGYGFFRCLEKASNEDQELVQQGLENEQNDILDDLSKEVFVSSEIKDYRNIKNFYGGE